MFKKLLLCLLLTTDLYSTDQEQNNKLSPYAVTAVVVVAGGLLYAMYASDDQKFEELTSKLLDGDLGKILEVAGSWFILTQLIENLMYTPQAFKQAYKDCFPTEEQVAIDKAAKAEIHEKLKYLKAEESFLDCFMSNKSNYEKNSLGCPTACEELAQALIDLGGKNEVDKMTQALKLYGK